MASDSAATFGAGGQATIGQQEVKKVKPLGENILYASTGAVGMGQLVSAKIIELWNAKAFSGLKTPESMMGRVGQEIANLVGTYLQTAQFQRALTGDSASSICKSMVAMPVGQRAHLFQFDINGAPECCTSELPFVALGSGQLIADPFLALLKRLLWTKSEPTIAEGRLAAVWTIEHVRRTNPGGVGGGIQLATLANHAGAMPKVVMATAADVEEHLQRVGSAEAALVNELTGKTDVPVKEIPRPAAAPASRAAAEVPVPIAAEPGSSLLPPQPR